MNEQEGVVFITVIGIAVVFITFIIARYNYLVKKVIAQNGFNPNDKKRKYNALDIACVLLSLGIGLGICAIYTTFGWTEDTFYLLVYATLFTCGGVGLIAAHFIRKKLSGD